VPDSTHLANNEGTPQDGQHPQDQILPLPRSSPGTSETEREGSSGDATRRRIQVLTKDELKDLLKARNLAGPGITKRTKDGEFQCFVFSSLVLMYAFRAINDASSSTERATSFARSYR
jgi:hypothetical protein